MEITYVAPQGVDQDALQFAGSVEVLLALQEKGLTGYLEAQEIKRLNVKENAGKTIGELICNPKVYRDQLQDLRKAFLGRFSASTYAREILFALAQQQKADGEIAPALDAFSRYRNLYPGSWRLHEAIYESAECQLALGNLDDAKALVDGLAGTTDVDVSLLLRVRRLARAVAAGERSLQKIEEIPLYPIPGIVHDEDDRSGIERRREIRRAREER